MKTFRGVVLFRNRREAETWFEESFGEYNYRKVSVRLAVTIVMTFRLFFIELPLKIIATFLEAYSTFCELVLWTTNPMVLKDTKAETEDEPL